jgi:hypothetical protein
MSSAVQEKLKNTTPPTEAGVDAHRSLVEEDVAVEDLFQTPPVDTSYAASIKPSRLQGKALTAMVSSLLVNALASLLTGRQVTFVAGTGVISQPLRESDLNSRE